MKWLPRDESVCMNKKEKGRYLTQSYDKSLHDNIKSDITKNFDYTTISDRLRMVSLSNYCNKIHLLNQHPGSIADAFIFHVFVPSPLEFCHSPRRQSIQQLYICLQETTFERGTWTLLTPWEPYIQSHRFFCTRSAGQPYHLEWRQVRMSLICHTYIGFQRYTKIHINTDALPVHPPSIHSSHKTLTHIKQGLQKYCETAYSRIGINHMCILKNSNELLEHLFKSPTFNQVTSIKPFDFSTLYTTIPHQKLKNRLISIIRNAFI